MEHENEFIKPPQILLKPELGKMLEFLTNKDIATVFKNIFKHYHQEPLEKMSPMATMFFRNVEEVLEYNLQKYHSTVQRNRKNGSKSKGRPTILKTQENPEGIIGYPNNPKDRDKDKDRDKVISKETINNKTSLKEISSGENYKLELLEKFKKLVELDIKIIKDSEDKNFIISAKNIASETGWYGFFQIIINSTKEELQKFINIHNCTYSEEEVLEIRKHCHYYLEKLIK
jgi:hypothetical protein